MTALACGGQGAPASSWQLQRGVANPTGECVATGDGGRLGHSPEASDVYLPDCESPLTREYYRVFVKADDTAYMIPRPDGHNSLTLACLQDDDNPYKQALERYFLCQDTPLTSAQVDVVNSMVPADALAIARELNDDLVFFVGAADVRPPAFAGDVLDLCKSNPTFRNGPMRERCDFELEAEASGSRTEEGWSHTGAQGDALAEALNELYGIAGDELCRRLGNDASRSLVRVLESVRQPCNVDADCIDIAQASACHDGCGAVIARSGQARADAARGLIDAEQCRLFERESCLLIPPPCRPPGSATCVAGTCAESR